MIAALASIKDNLMLQEEAAVSERPVSAAEPAVATVPDRVAG
jgi:hypothetical protein